MLGRKEYRPTRIVVVDLGEELRVTKTEQIVEHVYFRDLRLKLGERLGG